MGITRSIRTLIAVAAACAGLLISGRGDDRPPAPEPISFSRDIRPILSDRCYQCHGPDAAERKAGLRLDLREFAIGELPSGNRAIVPGAPDESELLQRVGHADPSARMPPRESGRKPVTAAEQDLLRRWIAEGADYESHWAFVAPRRPAVPTVADARWVRNPIDAFIRAAQEREGMSPSPEASRATLARRASFDLNGLPPSPEEVRTFQEDDAEGDALRRYVDRLFENARYGEHLARHWLDAARYGDTHGLHLDNERSMWPYREWVINSFNRNQRYDEFVVEQLAGDLLPSPTLEQKIATGFNRCNVTSAEGGMIQKEYLTLYAMDRVDTTSTVFLGLTIACAKCHDHKFDPISQREYYQLFAFFNSITEKASDGNAPIAPPFVIAPTAEQRSRIAEYDERIAKVEAELARPDPVIDAAQEAWEQEARRKATAGWVIVRPTSAYSAGGATVTIEKDRSVRYTGKSPERDLYEIIGKTHLRDVRGLRLELLPDPEQPGGGIGRAEHNNIVLTHVEITAAPLENCEQTTRVAIAGACADFNQRDFPIANALDDKGDTGWAIAGGTTEDRAAVFRFEKPVSYVGGTQFRIKLGFGSGFPQHTIARLRISATDRIEKLPATIGPWLRCEKPFPAADARVAFTTAYGPEKNPKADARYGEGDQSFGWVAAPEYVDGKIHLFSQLPRRAYYVQRIIDSPGERTFTFFVGSDDAVKVFMNGEEVLARDVRRGVQPDQDRVTVALKPGENRLLIKIVNDGGACGFYYRPEGESIEGVPTVIARILGEVPTARTESDRDRLRRYYRRNHSESWRARDAELRALKEERRKVEAAFPRTMVMEEMKSPRPAHILMRGQYDQPGPKVVPDVPGILPPLPDGEPRNRLTLARWLVDPSHPLTARVYVNRLWQMLFGTGLVATPEDFGSQGAYPIHGALLDWLAVEFVESGWDVRHMLRLMTTSSTYRQSSRVSPQSRARDPKNRWLARGPRHRLDAEQIRDAALLMGGLLVERVGGPSVRPYQPPGIWRAVGYTTSNTARFRVGKGDELWRRSIYTFWKRTAPPPTLVLFDAPSREACSVQRSRTNTPLQALALLNDVQFVEAARAFGARALASGGSTDDERLTWMWQWSTSRRPDAAELAVMRDLLGSERTHYATRIDDAKRLTTVGDSEPPKDVAPDELAAWMSVANLLLNLDETLTRG